jgi:hypothetical protein
MSWREHGHRWYVLDGHKVVPARDVHEWGRCFESADRIVAQDTIGSVRVSTVFLGLDHSFLPGGPPLFFETMTFGQPLDQECVRYSTWEEAEAGHTAMLLRVTEVLALQAMAQKPSSS